MSKSIWKNLSTNFTGNRQFKFKATLVYNPIQNLDFGTYSYLTINNGFFSIFIP